MSSIKTCFAVSHLLTALTILPGTTTSCVPSVYLIDRQTVLELEASGDWQELDQKFQEKELASGPLPTPKEKSAIDRSKIYRMTHSDQGSANPTKDGGSR